MRDLDHMRHIITEEEYYRKRAEILSDIWVWAVDLV
jgi:hypothetical protein